MTATAPAADDRLAPGTAMALLAMGLGVIVIANDFTALNVALPSIEHDFNVDVGTAQWVINAYALTFGMAIVAGGRLADADALLPDALDVLANGPVDRATLLRELAVRGNPDLGVAFNVLIPWIATQGLVLGTPDGRYRAAAPPPPVDEDEALATMAGRYLAGYGPASATDLAAWSGLPLGAARSGLAAIGPLERAGDLLALPGALDAPPPPAPPPRLLAAFDTTMLGWRRRTPLVPSAHDRRVNAGAGMVRATVLVRGAVAGTWRLGGSGRRRAIEVDWFGRPAAAQALDAEARDVGRFLDVGVGGVLATA